MTAWQRNPVETGHESGGRLTAGVMGDTPIGRGTPGETPALASDCHDDLLQADAVHALCQVAVPVYTMACG